MKNNNIMPFYRALVFYCQKALKLSLLVLLVSSFIGGLISVQAQEDPGYANRYTQIKAILDTKEPTKDWSSQDRDNWAKSIATDFKFTSVLFQKIGSDALAKITDGDLSEPNFKQLTQAQTITKAIRDLEQGGKEADFNTSGTGDEIAAILWVRSSVWAVVNLAKRGIPDFLVYTPDPTGRTNQTSSEMKAFGKEMWNAFNPTNFGGTSKIGSQDWINFMTIYWRMVVLAMGFLVLFFIIKFINYASDDEDDKSKLKQFTGELKSYGLRIFGVMFAGVFIVSIGVFFFNNLSVALYSSTSLSTVGCSKVKVGEQEYHLNSTCAYWEKYNDPCLTSYNIACTVEQYLDSLVYNKAERIIIKEPKHWLVVENNGVDVPGAGRVGQFKFEFGKELDYAGILAGGVAKGWTLLIMIYFLLACIIIINIVMMGRSWGLVLALLSAPFAFTKEDWTRNWINGVHRLLMIQAITMFLYGLTLSATVGLMNNADITALWRLLYASVIIGTFVFGSGFLITVFNSDIAENQRKGIARVSVKIAAKVANEVGKIMKK
jgi:hypothetical protein